ncbi:hypothetical protein KEM54_001475 [Ascosphaera aggregata]|nr:hypothetical protein KEM54_001475 [Ascosphaera aggregata]
MGLLPRRRLDDRQEPQNEQQLVNQPAKEPVKGAKRERLKRGLTKDGFTSFLRPVTSNTNSSASSTKSASQNPAAASSDAASRRGTLSRSRTLPDITVQPPGESSPPLPRLQRTNTATNDLTDDQAKRPKNRFTPSLPNIRDTLRLSKSTARRRSSPAVTPPPGIAEVADESLENQPQDQLSSDQQNSEPTLAPWTPEQLSPGARPPGSLELSTVGSVRSGKSRFFPSLQNIREHTGPTLRFMSRTRNGAQSSARTQTDDEGFSDRPSKEVSRFDFLLSGDRQPPGSRPSSAPGQLQEPKIDLLVRNPPPTAEVKPPKMMDSSTQTETAPEPAEQPEQTLLQRPLAKGVIAEAAIEEDDASRVSSHNSFRSQDYQFKPSTPKRTMSLPSVMHPGSYDKDTESYFVPTRRRSSDSSSSRRTCSVPPRSEHSSTPWTSEEMESPMETVLLSPSTAWKSPNKANTAVKRQRQNIQDVVPQEPASSRPQPLIELPIPDPSIDLPASASRRTARESSPGISRLPSRCPSRQSAQSGSRLPGTLLVPPDNTGRCSMSTSAGITAAVVGALAGAITVASRWSSPPSEGGSDPTSMMSIGEASPYSSVSLDARKVRQKNANTNPITDAIATQQLADVNKPSSQSLLQAAQSESAWQEHFGVYKQQESLVQDTNSETLQFDEELAAFQPNRPLKDKLKREDDEQGAKAAGTEQSTKPADQAQESAESVSSIRSESVKASNITSTAIERLSTILRHLKTPPSQVTTPATDS